MSYTTLICGEWSQISDITSGDISEYEYLNGYIDSKGNQTLSATNLGLTDPYIFNSFDEGKTWTISLADTIRYNDKNEIIYQPRKMINFEYMDSLHAIAMCRDFNYWRTEDGGKTWVLDSIISKNNESFQVTTFSNLAITNYTDTLFTSNDYGKSWSINQIKILSEFDIKKGHLFIDNLKIINKTTIIADGVYFVDFYHKDNVYFHTISTDLGKTWEVTSIKDKFSYYKYFNLGNNKIYAVGNVQVKPYSSEYRDLFKLSTDGGYSWNLILDTLSTPKQPLDGVEFIDDKNGIAFARDWAKLYRTSDGGMSWWRDNGVDEFQYPPHDYDYLPNGEILAVARTGKVYRWTDPSLSAPENSLEEKEREIKIYPNPAIPNQSINITFNPAIRGNALISIIDINGKILSTYKVTLNKFEEQFGFKPKGDLTAGTYFFQIGYSNGATERQKFVVE